MSGVVLDASSALAWCFRDEATPASRALLRRIERSHAEVPSLWPLEVANILAVAERRARIDARGIEAFVAVLHALDVRVDDGAMRKGLGEILALARAEGLTAYDAAYLDLAAVRGLPLATRDRALTKAAQRAGVAVIPA